MTRFRSSSKKIILQKFYCDAKFFYDSGQLRVKRSSWLLALRLFCHAKIKSVTLWRESARFSLSIMQILRISSHILNCSRGKINFFLDMSSFLIWSKLHARVEINFDALANKFCDYRSGYKFSSWKISLTKKNPQLINLSSMQSQNINLILERFR